MKNRKFKIYGCHYNNDNKIKTNDTLINASGFYLHGYLDEKNEFDLCMFNEYSVKQALSERISVVTTVLTNGEEVDSLLFCSFDRCRKKMGGYIVKIDSIKDIKDAIKEHKGALLGCMTNCDEAYIEENYPEINKLLTSEHNNIKYKN